MLLTTARLILRDYIRADFPLLHAIDADPAVTQMRGGSSIIEARYRERFEAILAGQTATPRLHYDFAILTTTPPHLIGHCFLHMTNIRIREATLGYFFDPAAWGQGFATEAAVRLLELGFGELGLHRISSGCVATNRASARVLKKAGMQYEGRLREDRLTDAGEWYDTLLYAMLEREWRA